MKIKSLLATALMVAGLSTSAFAQETTITPFISGWFNTFNTDTTVGAGEDKFDYSLSAYSTAGLLVERGNISGEVTLKLNKDNYLKRAYVSYNMGEDSISIGVMETLAWYNFGQVSNDYNALINYGALSDNTRPMVKWNSWGLNIAMIASGFDVSGTDKGLDATAAKAANTTAGDLTVDSLPRIDVSYDILSDMFNGAVFANYAPYYATFANDETLLVNSFVVGFGGQFTQGDLFADVTAYYGMNLGMTSSLSSDNFINPSYKADGKGVSVNENASSYGAALAVGYTIDDMYTPSVGFGYANNSLGNADETAYAVYANVNLVIYEGLSITPEVAFTNNEVDNGAGSTTTTSKFYVGFITEFAF